jgi:hypothetical protein
MVSVFAAGSSATIADESHQPDVLGRGLGAKLRALHRIVDRDARLRPVGGLARFGAAATGLDPCQVSVAMPPARASPGQVRLKRVKLILRI